jgi:hypothetical protein
MFRLFKFIACFLWLNCFAIKHINIFDAKDIEVYFYSHTGYFDHVSEEVYVGKFSKKNCIKGEFFSKKTSLFGLRGNSIGRFDIEDVNSLLTKDLDCLVGKLSNPHNKRCITFVISLDKADVATGKIVGFAENVLYNKLC